MDVKYLVEICDVKDSLCYQGGIDSDFISGNMSDYRGRILFICGPPAMVSVMVELCSELGCNKDSIRAENFIGY